MKRVANSAQRVLRSARGFPTKLYPCRGFATGTCSASSSTAASTRSCSAAILSSIQMPSFDMERSNTNIEVVGKSSEAISKNDVDQMSEHEAQEFVTNILAQQLGEDDPSVINLRKSIASRKAVLKRDWTDLDFQDGELNKSNLEKLERKFCEQMISSSSVLLEGCRNGQAKLTSASDSASDMSESTLQISSDQNVQSDAVALVHNPSLVRCFEDVENLGAALDLVGAYLKNYEVSKADTVMERIMPECRKLGGLWLTKALNHYSTVRMKQARYQEAKVMLQEQIASINLKENEAWEAFDMLYRNMGSVLTALGQTEEGLEFYQKSVRVKRSAGVEISWFDLWDIGKSHALIAYQQNDIDKILLARESIEQAVDVHERNEGQDKIMRAKILHSLGETFLASGVMIESKHSGERSDKVSGQNSHSAEKNSSSNSSFGDLKSAKDLSAEIENEYENAVKYFKQAHELKKNFSKKIFGLFATYSGQNCPLTGGQARAVADGLIRLQKFDECKPYLRNALQVESTKDAPQLNQLWHLLENVLTVYQKSDDRDLNSYVKICDAAIENVKSKGLHDEDPQLFANVCGKCMLISLAGGEVQACAKFASTCQQSLDEMSRRGIQDTQGLGGLIHMMQITQLASGVHKFG